MNSPLVKVAVWLAGALALGWLATIGALPFGGGHPPLWFVIGLGVVLSSFVVAPIGAAASLAHLWQARRRGFRPSRLAAPALGLNLLFLMVAVALWFWLQSEASRR